MATRIEWIFPNVAPSDGASGTLEAQPVRIFPYPPPSRKARIPSRAPVKLSSSELQGMGLVHIPAAIAALPGIKIRADSNCQWSVFPHPGVLGGNSGQLAAALSYVDRFADDGIERRLEQANVSRIWATGAIEQELSGHIRLRPVGEPDGNVQGAAFAAKLQAFARSGDPICLCVADDIFSSICPVGCRVCSLDDFLRWVDAPKREGGVIVAIERPELMRLVCALFPNVAPAGTSHVAVLVWRGRSDDDRVIFDVLRQDGSAITHLQTAGDKGRLFVFSSPDSAVRFGEKLVHRAPRSAVAIHLGDVDYDGFSVSGPVVNLAAALLEGAGWGSLRATGPVLGRLSWRLRGHLLPLESVNIQPPASVLVYDITPEKHPYELSVGPRPFSRNAYLIAKGLTIVRAPVGLLSGVLFATGWFKCGLAAYVAGLSTDVLDGLIARQWNGVSGWGKRYDGIFDMVFNTLAGAGFVLGALWVWHTPEYALYLAAGTICPIVLTYPFIPPGSRAAKCRSGVVRCVMIACVLPKISPELVVPILIALVPLLIVTATLEISVMLKDEQYGKHQGWFGAPPAALERPDQRFLQAIVRKLGLQRLANRTENAANRSAPDG